MQGNAREAAAMRRVRIIARLAALAAAVILSLPLIPWSWSPLVVPAASPYVMMGSAIALRAAGAAALIGLAVLVLVLRRPRWFCRWACPVGLAEESLGRIRSSAATLFARWPPVGQWIALVTLGGAVVGYPLLLWLDPLAMLSGFVGAWRWPLSLASAAAAAGLPAVLIFSVVFPHAWCMRVCPLGAVQDLLAWPRQWLRRRAGAGLLAPRYSTGGRPRGDHLPACGPRCIHRGLTLQRHFARRVLLAAGVGAACGAAVRAVCGGAAPPIRPPGAIDESRFTGVCIRCGNCVRACPAGIIRPDLGCGGVAGLLAPVVGFSDSYCKEDCRRCTRVCPSGALVRLSLEEKQEFIMGLARVDLAICILARGEECSACLRACPYEAILLSPAADGFTVEPRVDPAKCTGCGACEAACPTSPVKAIRVDPPVPGARGFFF